MKNSSGSETLAPLPLNKPAHIDNEAAIRESTVVSKKIGSSRASTNPTSGRASHQDREPSERFYAENLDRTIRNASLRFVDFP
ncbi:hypothetical protein CCGE531_14005 [Rhizobium sp. CCGE531]|nr:hypothetical protein CCGE531_14005 [Rhizobium sp. CCGE531]